VLVLGSDTRSFLSIVRSLGRSGLEVHSAWTAKDSIAKTSRYLRQTHDIAAPWDGDGNWINSLNDLHTANNYGWVVPCNDQAILPIREHRDSITQFDTYYLLKDQVFNVVNSKITSTALADSLGISVPRFATATNLEQLEKISAEFDFPLVLKPESSFVVAKLSKKREVATVRSKEELLAASQRMLLPGSRVQIQEYFCGQGTGVEFLAEQGELLKAFQHLRLHEPLNGGGSSYRKSIALHEGMLKATQKIIGELNYTGVGMVEFLWNRSTDQWRFVEINGRFWGSLPLALACGADFPADLHKNRWRQQKSYFPDYRVGIHCRNLSSDKNWLSDYLRSKETTAGKKLVSLIKGSCEIATRALTGKEYVDTFAWDDPKPFLAEVFALCKTISSGTLRKVRSRLRQTSMHRRRRHQQLLSQLVSATSILFICKGNICRSPFAERYSANCFHQGIRIASAGYYPASNRPAPENACRAAQQLGVCLRDHRSTQLTSQHISDFDLVMVFDEENLDRVQADFRECSNKTFLLHHVRDSGPLFVKDPYGASEKQFVATYREIMQSVDALAEQLSRNEK